LSDAPQGVLDEAAVRAALAHFRHYAHGFAERLAAARRWELRTIAERDAAVDRMLALQR
jgi:hypothetical protein